MIKSKLSAAAQQEEGKLRTCIQCDEEKIVTRTTFALKNGKDSLRGWHTTCRVCQGISAAEKRENLEIILERHSETTQNLIQDMYNYSLTAKAAEATDIGLQLAPRVRELYDQGKKLESFEMFIEVVKPLVAGWMEPGEIHDDIKKGLMSSHRRRLIVATRYSAKSTLTGIYVAWRIFLDPLIKIMVVSRGSKLAARMLRTVRRVFIENCPMLWHLRPAEDCLDNSEQFQVPQALKVTTGGVTLTSLGLTSNLPGFRSDVTIGDDVEGPQEDDPEKVMALEETLNELHMINPRGEKVMLGTYQSEFSIYAKLADLEDENGVKTWEEHRACMFQEDRIDGKLHIHSRWQDMFSDADGLDWRRSVTSRAWKLHAMLVADPSILHEKPLKIGDLPVLTWDAKGKLFPQFCERTGVTLKQLNRWAAPKGDEWHEARQLGDAQAPLATITMAVDPASGLAGRDAIGVAVLGITQGGLGIILHLEGVRATDKTLARRRVADIGRDFGVTRVVVEELADGLFGETLESDFIHIGYPVSVEKVTTGGQQKGRRIIESLGPPMGAGRLVIVESLIETDHCGEFVNQLVRISYDGRTGSSKDHDDIVDALAHAVASEKHSLVSDVGDNLAAARTASLDRWSRVPLRYGGLGDASAEEYPHTHSWGSDVNLSSALLEEDEVMIALMERRDRLQTVVNEELQMGRGADRSIVDRIKGLTRQIDELRTLQVL
jgi:hypothetical protein